MATNAMWRNEPDRLYQAKRQANAAKRRGEYVSAHSIMLSAYITVLGGQPVERHHPFKFTILALWHAFFMLRRSGELNHNQLDVLVQFLLKLRSKLRSKLRFVTVGRPYRWYRWHSLFDLTVKRLADEELAQAVMATKPVKSHQRALALMTSAEVFYAVDFSEASRQIVISFIVQALELEREIRAEEQPMGLRQFVRVLRKAGALYGKEGVSLGGHHKGRAIGYLNQALKLAQGEADAPDQVPKILAEIRNL